MYAQFTFCTEGVQETYMAGPICQRRQVKQGPKRTRPSPYKRRNPLDVENGLAADPYAGWIRGYGDGYRRGIHPFFKDSQVEEFGGTWDGS